MNDKTNSLFIAPRAPLALLIAAHLLIALPFAYYTNIWIDEASTLYTTGRGFLFAFETAAANEKQAPLYFWLLSLWRALNDSIFFARLFSVFCSILAIKFFGATARKFFDPKTAFFVAAFFAVHPYLIWASAEIRVYSAVILLTVLLLKFFAEGFWEENSAISRRARIFYVLTAIAALYTNYYLGFLLAGNFAALLALRRRQAARDYFLQMLIVGAAFLPLLWTIKLQFADNTGGFQNEKSLIEGLQILWNIFLTFALPTEIFPLEESSAFSLARLWLMRLAIVIILISVVVKRRKLNEKTIVFGAITVVVAAFLLAAYFLGGAIFVEIRHAAVLFAPLVLFGSAILEIVAPPENAKTVGGKRRALVVFQIGLLILIAISFSRAIYTLYPNLTKRGDWARVGEFIARGEKPDQPIIVFRTFAALALPFHYRGVNQIYPDEKFFDWSLEDKPGSADSLKRETNFIFSEIPPEAQEVWLLTEAECKVGRSCEPLEKLVQAHYTVIEEQDFYEGKVRLLRKK